jgi:pimeloyl-ACP methyl ester carboxylesterase
MSSRQSGDLVYLDDDFTDPWRQSPGVVLQHGYCRNGSFWYPWVPRLSEKFRVVRPDLRGCGSSADPGPDYVYRLEALVDDLLSIINDTASTAVHYVGEGIGGVIGALAATQEPARFRSLVLLGMPTRIDAEIQRGLAVGYPSWSEAVTTLGLRDWWIAARSVSGGLTGDPGRDDWVADQVGRTPVHVALGLAPVARAWDFETVLPRVPVPTLLLSSGNRFATSAKQQRYLAGLLPQSWEHRYEGVDDQFFMYQTIAQTVADDVAEFMCSVDKGRPRFVATTVGPQRSPKESEV